jgi:hypothetical protein
VHTTTGGNGQHQRRGVYLPSWLVLRVETIRTAKRPDLPSFSKAAEEALREWTERQDKAA